MNDIELKHLIFTDDYCDIYDVGKNKIQVTLKDLIDFGNSFDADGAEEIPDGYKYLCVLLNINFTTLKENYTPEAVKSTLYERFLCHKPDKRTDQAELEYQGIVSQRKLING
jgi:hypothetical protein